MEESMLKYYMANADKAGVGLECLPGVKQLLQELKVHHPMVCICMNSETVPRANRCICFHLCFISVSRTFCSLFNIYNMTTKKFRMHVPLANCGQHVMLSLAGP